MLDVGKRIARDVIGFELRTELRDCKVLAAVGPVLLTMCGLMTLTFFIFGR